MPSAPVGTGADTIFRMGFAGGCGGSRFLLMVAAALLVGRAPTAQSRPGGFQWSGTGCTAAACHASIAPIRRPQSAMFRKIMERGRVWGDPDAASSATAATRPEVQRMQPTVARSKR